MPSKKPAAVAQQDSVHTSAQTDTTSAGAASTDGANVPAAAPVEGCGACRPKPSEHRASALAPRDQYTGQGGRYVRDPVTGERKPASN